jgi:hypothetical protein
MKKPSPINAEERAAAWVVVLLFLLACAGLLAWEAGKFLVFLIEQP